MDNTQNNHFRIGLFVLVGCVLFGFSILLVGGDKFLFKDFYSLRVRLDQTQGLNNGSVVSLAGVTVGNIRKIYFSDDANQLEALIDIDQDYQQRITVNSVAQIKTKGALGDKFIYIDPGAPSKNYLPENSLLSSEDGGDFLDLIQKQGPEFTRIIDVIKELQTLVKSLNQQGRVAKTMTNLEVSTENLNDLIKEAKRLVTDIRGQSGNENNLKAGIQHFTNVLKKLDKGHGTLGALINDPDLYQKIVNMLGGQPRNQFLKPLIRDTLKEQEKIKKSSKTP